MARGPQGRSIPRTPSTRMLGSGSRGSIRLASVGGEVGLDPSQTGDPHVVAGRTFQAQRANILRGIGAGGLKPPTNTVRPTITGTAQEDETLTAVPGTWTGATVTRTYRLYRDGVFITGATASTYLVDADDVDAVLTVGVTAGNDAGSVEAISLPTATVIAAA